MRGDIEIPVVKNVYIAIVKEWNKEFLSKDWNSYIINDRNTTIEMVLVVTKGYDDTRKTSLLRHGIGSIPPQSFAKIEMLQEEVLEMNNEFSVTFFSENKLYDKKYIFEKNSISEKSCEFIPILKKSGILVK